VVDHLDDIEPAGLLSLAMHMHPAPNDRSSATCHAALLLDQLTGDEREQAVRGLELLANAAGRAMQKSKGETAARKYT
jgi:hypothetical protein